MQNALQHRSRMARLAEAERVTSTPEDVESLGAAEAAAQGIASACRHLTGLETVRILSFLAASAAKQCGPDGRKVMMRAIAAGRAFNAPQKG